MSFLVTAEESLHCVYLLFASLSPPWLQQLLFHLLLLLHLLRLSDGLLWILSLVNKEIADIRLLNYDFCDLRVVIENLFIVIASRLLDSNTSFHLSVKLTRILQLGPDLAQIGLSSVCA